MILNPLLLTLLVLFLVSHYRSSGGHENVLNNLAVGLERLGYKVTIGAFHFEENPPDPINTLYLSRLKNIIYAIKNIDIVHCHHAKMNYYSLLTSKPFIFHSHGTSSILQEINLKLSLLLCRRRISKLISVSNYSMCSIKKAASNIPYEIIYNGVDTGFYKEGLPRKYKVGDPQLLFVGNLYRYKNISRILNEIPRILESFPNMKLQIVGIGDDYHRIEQELREKNLKKYVDLVGELRDNEELRLRYSSCDIYVSASMKESFGIPLVEAMACGKPILVSDIPAHDELVKASGAGRTFSLNDNHGISDAIAEIVNNKNLYSTRAREFAMKNDWSNVCKQVSRVYEELITSYHK